jgi:hypothetical protein
VINFFKDFKRDFFGGVVPIRPVSYTIVIVFLGGGSIEKRCIENPWAYINSLKKNPKVKTAYIKDESNK